MTADFIKLDSGDDALVIYVVNALKGQWNEFKPWNQISTWEYTETWSPAPGFYSFFVASINNINGG